jgi:transcriptional regulator with XRE-family HTH domain
MTINTDWFKSLMADRRISQRELAKKIGVDHSALSLAFRGKRNMKMAEAADIARLLGVPVAEVMENAGIQSDAKSVPLRGFVDGHGEMHSEESDERIPAPHAMALGSFAIQCRTSSSPLEYMDGWLLFVAKPVDHVSAEVVGKFCLCRLVDGVQVIGTLRRGYKRGRYNLINANSQMTDVDVQWAAPILYIET